MYFTICLLNDIVGSNEISIRQKPLICKIKDYMYATLAFPVAMVSELNGCYSMHNHLAHENESFNYVFHFSLWV